MNASDCHAGTVGTERPGDVYDRVASAYERRFVDELASKPRDRELLDNLAIAVTDPVVELGCGPGQVGAYLRRRGRRVLGIDVSRAMTALAAQRLDGALVADMRSLPVADGAVGAVIAFYAVIHLPREDLSRAFREFARVLRPGGRLLVAVHEGEGDVTVTEFLDHPVSLSATFFALDELVAAADQSGLSVIAAERREPYPSEGQTVRLYLEAERRP